MEFWDEGCYIKSTGMFPSSASSGSTSSSSGSASASPSSSSSLLDFPSVQLRKDAPSSLKLELENIEQSLAATTTSTSRESLLDELLGDIRRSCATSLASTPTLVSQSEGEGENVFECKLRRSETELRTLSKWILWPC